MNKKRFNLSQVWILLLSLVAIFLLTSCSSGSSKKGSESSEDVYTIDTAAILDDTNIFTEPIQIFKEIVEEKSDGQIEINYIGGPEAIPAFNQGEAIENGTLDLSLNFSSYYAEMLPESLALNFSDLTYEEELERGSWDYMNEQHKQMNATTLGRVFDVQDGIYTKDKVESTSDLSGLKIRGTTKYVPALESFGSEVISMEGGEVYDALEKGLVDGVAWAEIGVTDLGLEEEINYEIQPKFNRIESVWLMNLDTYQDLPEDLQTVVEEAAQETYDESQEVLQKEIDEDRETLEDAGVESIELEDGADFQEQARDASWDWLEDKVDDYEELEKYFRE